MKNERLDACTMIGLHKLASQVGDGLVPELHELLSRRPRVIDTHENVTEFPFKPSRHSIRRPFGLVLEQKDNILRFPSAAASAARK